MTDVPVLVDSSSSVWSVILNRPERGNALSLQMVSALDHALDQAEAGGATAVKLSGAGRHFCTGFDLSTVAHETDDSLLARFVRIELLLQRVARAPFLTVAHATGRTMGAGADLFAACKVRVAATDATLSFPGAKGFGLVLGTRRLAMHVGRDKALAWVETGASISARQALEAGLVTQIADDAQAIESFVAERLHDNHGVQRALQMASEPFHAEHDAQDLAWLVRSAAVPGLQRRVAAYVGTRKLQR